MTSLITFLLVLACIDGARKQWHSEEFRHDMRVQAWLWGSLAVLIALACWVQTETGRYALGAAWYAVQFVGIEGPGFVIALALTRELLWLD